MGRLDGEAFPCETIQGRRTERGRGPLGTIGSPTIRGINMPDTSPPRGNAFVTPGNISVPSLSLLSLPSPFSFYPRFPTPRPLSLSPLFTPLPYEFRYGEMRAAIFQLSIVEAELLQVDCEKNLQIFVHCIIVCCIENNYVRRRVS